MKLSSPITSRVQVPMVLHLALQSLFFLLPLIVSLYLESLFKYSRVTMPHLGKNHLEVPVVFPIARLLLLLPKTFYHLINMWLNFSNCLGLNSNVSPTTQLPTVPYSRHSLSHSLLYFLYHFVLSYIILFTSKFTHILPFPHSKV